MQSSFSCRPVSSPGITHIARFAPKSQSSLGDTFRMLNIEDWVAEAQSFRPSGDFPIARRRLKKRRSAEARKIRGLFHIKLATGKSLILVVIAGVAGILSATAAAVRRRSGIGISTVSSNKFLILGWPP